MSHIVTIKTELKDHDLLKEAVNALNDKAKAANTPQLEILPASKHHLFSGDQVGLGIRLPGWNYPVVIDEQGVVKYDNYGGSWGKQIELDRLVQEYSLEALEREARTQGYFTDRVETEAGAIKLDMKSVSG